MGYGTPATGASSAHCRRSPSDKVITATEPPLRQSPFVALSAVCLPAWRVSKESSIEGSGEENKEFDGRAPAAGCCGRARQAAPRSRGTGERKQQCGG